jgi:hypothetical protein
MTSIAYLLDNACTAILDGYRGGNSHPSELHVSGSAFETIAQLKQDEVSRGDPLMLLDLVVVADRSLRGNATTVIWLPDVEQE